MPTTELHIPLPLPGLAKASTHAPPRSSTRAAVLTRCCAVHNPSSSTKLFIAFTETASDLRLPTPLPPPEPSSSSPLIAAPIAATTTEYTILRRLAITTTTTPPQISSHLAAQYDIISYTPHSNSSLAALISIPNSIITVDYTYKIGNGSSKSPSKSPSNTFTCPIRFSTDSLKQCTTNNVCLELLYGPALANEIYRASFLSTLTSFYNLYKSIQHAHQRPFVCLSSGTSAKNGIVAREDAVNFVAATCGIPHHVVRGWCENCFKVIERYVGRQADGVVRKRGVRKRDRAEMCRPKSEPETSDFRVNSESDDDGESDEPLPVPFSAVAPAATAVEDGFLSLNNVDSDSESD